MSRVDMTKAFDSVSHDALKWTFSPILTVGRAEGGAKAAVNDHVEAERQTTLATRTASR